MHSLEAIKAANRRGGSFHTPTPKQPTKAELERRLKAAIKAAREELKRLKW